MTNIEKAIAALNTFTTGNIENIEKYVAEDYIQHNPQVETGKEGIINFVKSTTSNDTRTTIQIIRSFEDGDYVILHSLCNFAGTGEHVAFDIFRFEEGMLAEHWDNMAPKTSTSPSGHSQIDGATEVTDLDKTDANKKLVVAAVKEVLVNKNLDMLPTFVNGEKYIQHNTSIADGVSGVVNATDVLAKMAYDKIHFVYGEGNFVLVVSEGSFDGVHTSYYDLFRVQDSILVEHWVVKEPIAKEAKNNNGKF